MQIGHRYRCYPTHAQAQTLLRWIGCQRFIYNAKVGEDRYFRRFARSCLALTGHFAPVDQQYSHFKTDLTPWLFEYARVALVWTWDRSPANKGDLAALVNVHEF